MMAANHGSGQRWRVTDHKNSLVPTWLAKEFLLNQLHARVQQSQPLGLNSWVMGCGKGATCFYGALPHKMCVTCLNF